MVWFWRGGLRAFVWGCCVFVDFGLWFAVGVCYMFVIVWCFLLVLVGCGLVASGFGL